MKIRRFPETMSSREPRQRSSATAGFNLDVVPESPRECEKNNGQDAIIVGDSDDNKAPAKDKTSISSSSSNW